MNKTNTSSFSRRSHKPENFRVMVKQRHNHKQRAEAPNRNAYAHLSKSQHIDWKDKDKGNYTEIKDYVRNRMKTDHDDNDIFLRQQQLSQLEQKRERSRSLSRSMNKQDYQNSLMKEGSLSGSPIREDRIQKNSLDRSLEMSSGKAKVGTLDALEKRIEEVIDKRLSICMANNKSRDDELQVELEQMISTLRFLRKEDPETIEIDINYLNRKIKLLQRLMAENMTESEIMKRFYLAKLTKSRHIRHNTDHYTPARKLSVTRYCESALKSPIVESSIARQTYKAPEQTAYNIYRYNNRFFNADRHKQPLPRSSYNREFLVNPSSKDNMIVPVDNEFMGRTHSAKFLNSSYRLEFSPKKVEKFDCKQLDACKNKIKSLAVVYGKEERHSLSPNSYNAFLSKLREPAGEKKAAGSLLTVKKMLTESRRQYRKTEGTAIASEIKHENLTKLRYQYLKKMKI